MRRRLGLLEFGGAQVCNIQEEDLHFFSLCILYKSGSLWKTYLWTISIMQNNRNALSSWTIIKMKRWSSPLRDKSNHDLEIQKSWYINDQIQCIRIVPHNKSHHVIVQFHTVSRYQRRCIWFGPNVWLNWLVRDPVNCTKHDFPAKIRAEIFNSLHQRARYSPL